MRVGLCSALERRPQRRTRSASARPTRAASARKAWRTSHLEAPLPMDASSPTWLRPGTFHPLVGPCRPAPCALPGPALPGSARLCPAMPYPVDKECPACCSVGIPAISNHQPVRHHHGLRMQVHDHICICQCGWNEHLRHCCQGGHVNGDPGGRGQRRDCATVLRRGVVSLGSVPQTQTYGRFTAEGLGVKFRPNGANSRAAATRIVGLCHSAGCTGLRLHVGTVSLRSEIPGRRRYPGGVKGAGTTLSPSGALVKACLIHSGKSLSLSST